MHLEPSTSSFTPNLLTPRQEFKPYHYPRAAEFFELQQGAHWLPKEVPMATDTQDWAFKLTAAEKAVVGGVLKGFIQAELVINDYWTQQVARWFRHPEVVLMATTFGAMEGIHATGYAHLNDTLGIKDYDAFLQEPTAKAKIDRVTAMLSGTDNLHDMALSLAVFSAFTEGVSLFSSFAVLLNFSRFNKLKGVGQIVSWSIRDESLHSRAGCWLFNTLVNENPGLLTPELKKEITEAARATVALEDAFIDQVFELGPIEGLDPADLKAFIRHRANTKLHEIGLPANWRRMDADAIKRMEWFDFMSAGVEHQDFFAQRVTDYSKASMDFDRLWD